MSGWDKRRGQLNTIDVSEDKFWSLFNFEFTFAHMKSTYKYALIKSILDNLLNAAEQPDGLQFISSDDLFCSFSECYWNLVVKYQLHQMILNSGQSQYTKIESIFYGMLEKNETLKELEFSSLSDTDKKEIVKNVSRECRNNVIGALYSDFEGLLYQFDLAGFKGIWLSPSAFNFMLKFKYEIEKLNYYAWAKMLEKINRDRPTADLLDHLELSIPERTNLNIYQQILYKEFQEDTCFYCGKKLKSKMHVDHFIPWSFVKTDKLWNFVLSCPACNIKKSNKIVSRQLLMEIEQRNERMIHSSNPFVKKEFLNYKTETLDRLWAYAKLSGFKEYSRNDNS